MKLGTQSLLLMIIAMLVSCQSPSRRINQGNNLPKLTVTVDGMDNFQSFIDAKSDFILSGCVDVAGDAAVRDGKNQVIFTHRTLEKGMTCSMSVKSQVNSIAGLTDHNGNSVFYTSPNFNIVLDPKGGLMATAEMLVDAEASLDARASAGELFMLSASFSFPEGTKVDQAKQIEAWLTCQDGYGTIPSDKSTKKEGLVVSMNFMPKKATSDSLKCSEIKVRLTDSDNKETWFSAKLNGSSFNDIRNKELEISSFESPIKLSPYVAGSAPGAGGGGASPAVPAKNTLVVEGITTPKECKDLDNFNDAAKRYWFDYNPSSADFNGVAGVCKECNPDKSKWSTAESYQCAD